MAAGIGASPRAPQSGVLLVNLGTPDAPTPSAVRRYLREFLSDPRVVELPRYVWLPILYLLVLPFRPGKTAHKYASIWKPDGSPLRIYHERQAQLLKGYLGQRAKALIPVVAAMRYGKPSIADGLAELKSKGCSRILVIPMYPQYAGSATGSVEDALERRCGKQRPAPEIRVVKDFHDHRAYAKAIAKNINDYWFKHGRPDKLVLSFHGMPQGERGSRGSLPGPVPRERPPHRHRAGVDGRAHGHHVPVAVRRGRMDPALHLRDAARLRGRRGCSAWTWRAPGSRPTASRPWRRSRSRDARRFATRGARNSITSLPRTTPRPG
jgi:hypothetical protein